MNRVDNHALLRRRSPGVNAGLDQDWMAAATDLDGRHRQDVFSGRVDIGAYEVVPVGGLLKLR